MKIFIFNLIDYNLYNINLTKNFALHNLTDHHENTANANSQNDGALGAFENGSLITFPLSLK